MTRARDVSRLVTTPSSAYDEFEEVFVGSASPTDKKIWIDNTTASAPVIQTFSAGEWFGSRLPSRSTILVNYLVIAGGGGALGSVNGSIGKGGGGAGGYRTSAGTSGNLSPSETSLSVVSGTFYNITVGSGGPGVLGGLGTGTSGSDSIFDSITSIGGGRSLISGGSGGGGHYLNLSGGSGTTNQGSAGGNAVSNHEVGAGGGGAGAVGINTQAGSGGAGGAGIASSITGTTITRAGGGGGGGHTGTPTAGAGGLGGGGIGGTGNSTLSAASGGNGIVNTGSGGGGAARPNSTGNTQGGNGGSGVVIIKFPDTYSLTVGPGLTSSNTTSGGFKIYEFTAGSDTVVFS
jgi:hypothetical protein